MKIEDIMEMWTKDSSIDETELATESSNIPVGLIWTDTPEPGA